MNCVNYKFNEPDLRTYQESLSISLSYFVCNITVLLRRVTSVLLCVYVCVYVREREWERERERDRQTERFKHGFHSVYILYTKKSSAQQEENSFQQQIGLKFKEETSKVLHLEHSIVLCWNFELRKVDQEHLKSFKMWCWRRVEIS